jgi:catechol 2,3-dioxygenase-like lactoylglutathione lyase family enzyme
VSRIVLRCVISIASVSSPASPDFYDVELRQISGRAPLRRSRLAVMASAMTHRACDKSTDAPYGPCAGDADYESPDLEATRVFYTRVLGLEEGTFGGGYIGFGSGQAQVVFAPSGVEPALPHMGVDVDSREAVDAAHAGAVRAGHEVIYGPVDEPWSVRRFFVRDPQGDGEWCRAWKAVVTGHIALSRVACAAARWSVYLSAGCQACGGGTGVISVKAIASARARLSLALSAARPRRAAPGTPPP